MHTHTPHIRRFGPRALARFAWVPLCVLLAAVAYTVATGHGVVDRANASNIIVTGSVAGTGMYVDATECIPSAGAIGDVLLGTDAWRTAKDASSQVCKLTFGAPGNPLGADLLFLDDPGAGGTGVPALRCTSGACAGQSIADYTSTSEPATNTNAFGTQLLNVGGAASAVWTPEPAVYDVGDVADVACHTTTTADGNCSFTWGVTGAATATPGNYVAHVQSLAVAR